MNWSACLTPPILAFSAMSALPGGAVAENWYLRADAGASIDGSADISSDAPIGGDASVEDGSLLAAGVGYASANGWRIEAEISRREGDLGAAPLLDPGGSVEITAFMANLYWDFGDQAFRPYVGLGLGHAQTELKATFTPPLSTPVIDNDDTGLAYQVMLGAAFNVAEHAALDVGYRYFAAPGFEGTGVTQPAATVPVEADFNQHAFNVGLRWSF